MLIVFTCDYWIINLLSTKLRLPSLKAIREIIEKKLFAMLLSVPRSSFIPLSCCENKRGKIVAYFYYHWDIYHSCFFPQIQKDKYLALLLVSKAGQDTWIDTQSFP